MIKTPRSRLHLEYSRVFRGQKIRMLPFQNDALLICSLPRRTSRRRLNLFFFPLISLLRSSNIFGTDAFFFCLCSSNTFDEATRKPILADAKVEVRYHNINETLSVLHKHTCHIMPL